MGLCFSRLVGGDQGHEAVADVGAVVVGRVHEGHQVDEEAVVVEGDGAADVDELVLRLPEALLRHELLLVELLAGTQARVGDLDVHAGAEARQLDEVFGQGVDLHGPAHVQHEDLAAVGVGPRQHHQAHGLGDGHEVADHVRVGHGDGAALGDLPLEDGDHGAIAAQHVPEADRHELGPDILEDAARAVLVRVLIAHVREELGDLVGLARLDLGVKALDDHFAEALRSAHDVGGVHSLVRGDEHEPLAAVDHGRIGGLVGADHVVLHGLAGAVLHEGHVLMGRRVVDHLGPIPFEHLEDAAAVPDGADEGDQLQRREVGLELQLDIVGVVLVDVEDDQLLRVVSRDLAAELAADGPAAAGDQHPLAMDETEDLAHVRLDGLPAQQVLHGHVLHVGHGDLAREQLVYAGQLLELAVRMAADVQDVPLVPGGGAGNGQEDLVHAVLLHVEQDVVPAAHHGDALDVPAPLVGIVVDDADHLVLRVLHQAHIPEDQLPRVAGADEHDPAQGFALPGALPDLEPQQPIAEANGDQEKQLQGRAGKVVEDGHPMDEEDDGCRVQHAGQNADQQQPHQLREAGVAPEASVQPEGPQQQHRHRRIGDDEHGVRAQVFLGDHGVPEIEPAPQRGEPGEANRRKVVCDHEGGHHPPPLYAE